MSEAWLAFAAVRVCADNEKEADFVTSGSVRCESRELKEPDRGGASGTASAAGHLLVSTGLTGSSSCADSQREASTHMRARARTRTHSC